MPTKDLHHKLTGDSTSLERALHRGDSAMQKAAREARRLEAEQRRLQQAMASVGRGVLVAGAAIAAGLALSVRAAIEWETAWAGVLKTVDGTDTQMAALEEEIRSLTGVLPASHREIAAVAEAAGQLGIQREDIAAFTKVMIDMGEATNLTSDEAATALARLMNIMQTAPADVSRLASAIVDLGNKGATTESEITEMALRIAGAGATIGLSEQQVLAWAAALSNVGIRAEAGGSAISRVFLEIDTAVSMGGEKLEVFARTAGMTAAKFQQAYQRDAGGAIAAFVQGLSRVQESGGDVNAILRELGITEIRTSDALRRLAGSGDNLTRTLRISSQAWDENTALAAEAERRYGTTAAQLRIARNQVNDFAIDMGNTFLPILGAAAEHAAALAGVIGDLPGPVKAALAVIAAATAGLLLLSGAALVAIPRIVAVSAALDTWSASSARGAAAVGLFRRAVGAVPLGPLTAAFAVATVVVGIFAAKQAESKARVEELSQTLDQQTGSITDNTRAWVAHELETRGVLEAAERLGLDLATLTDAITGERAALDQVNRVIDENTVSRGFQAANTADLIRLGQEHKQTLLAQGVSERDATKQSIAFTEALAGQHSAAAQVQGATRGLTGDVEDAVAAQQRQAEASGQAAEEMESLDPATRDLAGAFDVAASSAEDVAAAVDDLDKELKQLFDRVFGLSNAQDDLADAFDALTEQIQQQKDAGVEGAGALDGMTEAARENRDLAQQLLEKYGALTLETIRQTGSQEDAEKAAADFKTALEELAEETGTNVEELEGYNDVVAEIERLIRVTFETPGVTAAEAAAKRLREQLANIDRFVTITFRSSGAASVGSFRVPGLQHGGEVAGSLSAPPDSRLIAATPGEFMIRRQVAQPNLAAVAAFNATGRWPVGGGGSGGGAGFAGASGGQFTGALYLDSGQLLGLVRGEIRQGQAAHDRELLRGIGQGVGAAP